MNGDLSGSFVGGNGNNNFVNPSDSSAFYYNNSSPMLTAQPGMQDQSLQQQLSQLTQPATGHLYSHNMARSLASPALARALSSIHSDKTRRPRSEKKPIPDEQKDEKYFERRRRNNEAAKKSRDARKAREDDLAIRASYLEKNNSVLKVQLGQMREEAMKLRNMWFTKCQQNQATRSVMQQHQQQQPQQQQQPPQQPGRTS